MDEGSLPEKPVVWILHFDSLNDVSASSVAKLVTDVLASYDNIGIAPGFGVKVAPEEGAEIVTMLLESDASHRVFMPMPIVFFRDNVAKERYLNSLTDMLSSDIDVAGMCFDAEGAYFGSSRVTRIAAELLGMRIQANGAMPLVAVNMRTSRKARIA
ncbi:hypothetical protein Pyrfu_0481 [Pyrolobus fumarii 1A]|uniref:Uncharacterized protein n=1 Tax=Pyrolobus fumarii (strain DSM 11204 / 1A) TaxID=694429 RepID=G0EGH8_PYRF1|nr:hypothetical protein [Pyrolobus fumarii]AEM38352.1 hypothetical protein Pyrfu_0481 [Pyrolobus fumarii 1A]